MHDSSSALLAAADAASVPAAYVVETIDSRALVREAQTKWQQFLASGVSGKNVLNDPVQIELQLALEPEFEPHVLVLRRNGQIRCIAPFYRRQDKFSLQVSVVRLASLKFDVLKVFGDNIVVAVGEVAEDCYRAVFDALRESSAGDRVVLIDNLNDSSPLGKFCSTSFSGKNHYRLFMASSQREKHHTINFPATHNEFMASLSYETRRKLRRFTRRLEAEKQARLERVTRPEQVPDFLDKLDRIFRDTWQAKTFGYQKRDTESRVKYYTGIAEQGWLRAYLLVSDDEPIAFGLGYQYDNTYYFDETGFSQTLADYGPGTVLLHLMIEDFYQSERPDRFDFGVGDAAYKRSFGNEECDTAAVYLVPRNRWRTLIALQRGLFAFERRARSLLVSLKLDRAVRKFLKKQK